MGFGTAVITLAVGAIAVLPRVPALTRSGREQARVQHDSELWSAMPHGVARDRLGADIEQRTHELLQERDRDKTVENGWLYGTAWLALAWGLLVTSTAVTGAEAWAGYVRTALGVVGLTTGAVGVFILAVTGALVVRRSVLQVYMWVRARRRPTALTYDI